MLAAVEPSVLGPNNGQSGVGHVVQQLMHLSIRLAALKLTLTCALRSRFSLMCCPAVLQLLRFDHSMHIPDVHDQLVVLLSGTVSVTLQVLLFGVWC